MSILDVGQQTVKVHDGQNPNKKLKVDDFYESSHFMVETLKGEFCRKKEDGWYEMK